MRRRVITTAKYHGKAKDIFLEALEFRELTEAMSGIAEYDGFTDKVVQQGQTYLVDVTIFKVFKTKDYEMFIEYLDANACVLQSREKGGVIKMWDHKLTVRQDSKFAIWSTMLQSMQGSQRLQWLTLGHLFISNAINTERL